MRGRLEIRIEFKISYTDTMLNYCLSQKFKLLENSEFNHLTIILTMFFHNLLHAWYPFFLIGKYLLT